MSIKVEEGKGEGASDKVGEAGGRWTMREGGWGMGREGEGKRAAYIFGRSLFLAG